MTTIRSNRDNAKYMYKCKKSRNQPPFMPPKCRKQCIPGKAVAEAKGKGTGRQRDGDSGLSHLGLQRMTRMAVDVLISLAAPPRAGQKNKSLGANGV